ncbi:MAG: response regulator [Planctomyces sp.]|nr:response regulator [Planctomyces sp.]
MSGDEFRFTGTTGAVAHQILVVEDDQETAASLKAALIADGFSVTLAKDGGQAHSSFVMHKPDVVVLDLILPRESGFEVCERIKTADPYMPVVILTAIELKESRVLADRVGADAYLNKPCDPEKLVETIRDVAEKCWAKRHLTQPATEERVRFNCRCGKRFKVKASHRGKSLTCPMCGEQLTVPR